MAIKPIETTTTASIQSINDPISNDQLNDYLTQVLAISSCDSFVWWIAPNGTGDNVYFVEIPDDCFFSVSRSGYGSTGSVSFTRSSGSTRWYHYVFQRTSSLDHISTVSPHTAATASIACAAASSVAVPYGLYGSAADRVTITEFSNGVLSDFVLKPSIIQGGEGSTIDIQPLYQTAQQVLTGTHLIAIILLISLFFSVIRHIFKG